MATNSVITKVTGTDTSSNRIGSTFYGTCATAAATAAKVVTLSDSCVFTNDCLVTGVTIHVKFTYSNTNATPTLTVDSAATKQIMKYGTTKAGTTTYTSWHAGAVVSFTYDGTYWQMNDYVEGIDISTKMDKANPTGSGSFSLNRKAGTITGTDSVAVGYNTTASGNYSHAEGSGTTASGLYSHSEGNGTTASNNCAHAEGASSQATGSISHAEGAATIASGAQSHAEGATTQAIGPNSHAEGGGSIANGGQSHAEGGGTTATGGQSHAEGLNTQATGDNSHAEGNGTIASGPCQHAGGKFNISDPSNLYAEIIGNGTDGNNRSNARTLDWQGNETLAGDLIINGNQSVTQAISTISVTIPASGWTEDTTNNCYYNDVTVSEVTASDNYEIVGFTPSSTIADNTNIRAQLGYIIYGITSAGSIQFTAIDEAPTIDLPIVLRRVM